MSATALSLKTAMMPETLAGAALVAEHQSATERKQAARARRLHQGKQQIDQVKAAAVKLRKMADRSLVSGIVQGTLSLGAAAASIKAGCQRFGQSMTSARAAGVKAGCKHAQRLGKLKQQAAVLGRRASNYDGLAQTFNAVAKVRPLQYASDQLGADRADLEVAAKRSEENANWAGDAEQASTQHAEKMQRGIERILEAEHAAQMASIRASGNA